MKRFLCIVVFMSCLLLVPAVDQNAGVEQSPAFNAARPAQLRSTGDFGRMPLYFIANQGQMDKQVAFYAAGKDKTIYFTPEGLTIALSETKKREEGAPSERWVVKLDFIGANRKARPAGVKKTGALVSYFKGKPEEWHTGLPTYSKVVYLDLWPGIDLVYHGTVNRLKYEFIVHPGADPSRIRLAYRGATDVSLTARGQIEVTTPLGNFQDDVPQAFQEIAGKRASVSLAYRLGEGPANQPPNQSISIYGFQVGAYNPALPLVIDPAILVYCGYVGGSSGDYGSAIAVDSSGNAYITGSTSSDQITFPVAVGPDITHNGGGEAFVAKVSASGTALIYCGYIGGSTSDSGCGIAVDSSGSAYITGHTLSSQSTFPVTVGPDLTYAGNFDGFVAKVSASGTALIYCGYIGGSSDDFGWAIAVDGSENAYITGQTKSVQPGFPAAVGPDVTYNGGYTDAFVAKVNASGTGFSYCGYIGGSGQEYGLAIDVRAGYAYVTGYTDSNESSFPVAVGPDLTINGHIDVFVAKVNDTGTGFSYCGYIGGSEGENGYGIAVDGSGNAFVTGNTSSSQSSFPVSAGPDLTHNGSADAFVAKIDASGTALTYCGYLGGSSNDWGRGIDADSSGNAYITGYTESTESSFPVIGGPDLTFNGGFWWDAFVAKVNTAGDGLIYCGYIGGSGDEKANGIAVDISGNAYVVGQTQSSEASFPVTVGPNLTYSGAYDDAFVAKIIEIPVWLPRHAVGDFDGDGADEAAVDFGSTGIYLYDNGIWTQISSANPESLVAADVDGDSVDEILADLGSSGLWLWNAGAWGQMSGVNGEGMAAGDVDADGTDEVVGDFGTVGMWLYNGGSWSQLSGVNADFIDCANPDGSGGEEIVGDFGLTGLWIWNAGAWTQLSGVNADYVAFGDTNGLAGEELIGDFGSTGLWLWSTAGGWLQLSGVNADYMITGDVEANGDDELFGDFAATGLWLWDSGSWTQLSGVDADYMIRADVDGNGDDEVIGDFGAIGLWLVNSSSWTQLSGVNAEYMMMGDVDGDNADEILADFGPLGLWLWNGGSWSQISALNPE